MQGQHAGFKIINVNARSLINKAHALEALVIDHAPDIAVITETWLHKNILDSDIAPPGYSLVRRDRDGRGGGVAVLVKRNIIFSTLEVPGNIEAVWITTKLNNRTVFIGAVYRPPNSQ